MEVGLKIQDPNFYGSTDGAKDKSLLTVLSAIGTTDKRNGFLITYTESIGQALTTFCDIVVTGSSNHLQQSFHLRVIFFLKRRLLFYHTFKAPNTLVPMETDLVEGPVILQTYQSFLFCKVVQ